MAQDGVTAERPPCKSTPVVVECELEQLKQQLLTTKGALQKASRMAQSAAGHVNELLRTIESKGN